MSITPDEEALARLLSLRSATPLYSKAMQEYMAAAGMLPPSYAPAFTNLSIPPNQGANTPMATVTKPKFNVGDRVTTTGHGPGTVVIAGGWNDVNGMVQPSVDSYCLELDSGESNGGSPAGMNFLVEYLTPVEAPAKKPGHVEFDSVILAEDKKLQILDAISQVDNHDLIFKKWGFGEIFEKGTAISMLFYGQPETGKTLIAQAIADKYGKKLVMVSTAEIETPEPGGAERNLKKYFEEASKGGHVLLLDECDSLICHRGNVGMIVAAQINALLTELERHKGIVIFTTNRLGSLDPAFDRRLSLKLEFEMPNAEERVKIWQRMFPKKAPVQKDIDWASLAQVEIAGGHIKNVVLKAARRAAAGKLREITEEVIWDALEQEVSSNAAFQEAIDDNNPWYGTPLKGAAAMTGPGLSREPGKLAISRPVIDTKVDKAVNKVTEKVVEKVKAPRKTKVKNG